MIHSHFSHCLRGCARLAFLVLTLAVAAGAQPQASLERAPEQGKFRLHKFAQEIGEETYSVIPGDKTVTVTSKFLFTDRGSPVPLNATFTASADYLPQSFSIQGKTCRFCPIDWDVQIAQGSARVRQEKETRTGAVPPSFFVISGYAPVAMQMAMMRYWRSHGSPAQLAVIPSGEIRIHDRGAEKFELAGRTVQLRRYTVRGLIWGMETLWMDSADNLVALVSTDAEFDHFEAIRDEYEPLLSTFISSAARDEMAALSELAGKLSAAASGTLAFTGATLIDGTGQPPIANSTIVIRGGRIVAAGPSNQVKIPAEAQRIDVAGKFIIPGLWDMHAHYEQVEWGPIYLAAGVTTVRDVGNEFDFITAVRDALATGHGLGPRMLMAGIVDGDSKFALGVARVNSSADAKTWVQRYHDSGFQQIKIYSSVKPENVKTVCAEAHRLGMTVTGHIPIGMNAYDGVNDGMDQINHINFIYELLIPEVDRSKMNRMEQLKLSASVDVDSPAAKKAIQFLKDHGTVIDPTVALLEMNFRSTDEPVTKIEPGVAKVAPELHEQLVNIGVPPEIAPIMQTMRQKILQLIGALHHSGIPIVVGTDQAVPGYSVYREMELYVEAGFTPLAALQAATIVPARVMRLDTDTGTVQTGKRADFDILDANPLADIHNIRTVRSVVSNGVLYSSAPLWESVGFKP